MVESESAGAPAMPKSPSTGMEVLDKLNICRLPRDGYTQPFCQVDVAVASGHLLEQLVGVTLEGHAGT
eukprot:1198251-Pyramimonas_sp.AAC.1